MGKYKYLLKNVGLMTISNFSSKVLSFLMVPLYTNVLSTNEYGTYDFYITTILLLTPLLSFNILDAVIRYSLDEDNDNKTVFTIGVKYCINAVLVCGFLVIFNGYFSVVDIFNQYPVFFFAYFALSLFSDLLNQFARGIEHLTDVAVAGVINTAALIALNIIFLLGGRLGLEGYFLAYCMAFGVSDIYLLFRLKAWRYIDTKCFKRTVLEKSMKTYSMPMIFQNIGAWINNLSDRYIVTWICGSAANGIYSIAYKIPSMLTVFQSIFNQAWTISAVKTKDGKSGEFYSEIYGLYNMGFVLCCAILIAFDKVVARILFSKDFYLAWKYSPFLLISVVFNSMAGFLGGILIAQKKTNMIAFSTIVGAGGNIVLNIILINVWGPIGAAVATMVSAVIVWAVRLLKTQQDVRLKIRLKRDVVAYLILSLQACVLILFEKAFVIYLIELMMVSTIVVLYKNDMGYLVAKLLRGRCNKTEDKR